MIDFTLFPADYEIEFDLLSAILECAEHTPAPFIPTPTTEELLLTKQRFRNYAKKYRSKHPDKIKIRSRLKTTKVVSSDANANDVTLQHKTQKDLCWWCGVKLNGVYEVDHRVPLTKGGSSGAGNIVIACPKCNHKKASRMPYEFNGRLL